MHGPLNVKIIFPQNRLHYPRGFSTFTWVALCQSVRIICWGVEVLHTSCVSVRRLSHNGVIGVHPSGGQKDGSRRGLNRYCSEGSGEQSISLLQMSECGLALPCRRMTWFIFLFVHTLRIRCSNFFNIWTYRSEPIVAYLHKNRPCGVWSTVIGLVTSVLIMVLLNDGTRRLT
jgi:hypothetical protein